MSKINPGSNFNEDNDLATATPGMQNVDIPEAKRLGKEFQCPACGKTYNSKEGYLSHALAHHQTANEAIMEEKQVPTTTENLQELSAVPYEKGFHFYTEVGQYTGITAISLAEFQKKINTVPVESVVFHFNRQDYQKWLRNVFGDQETAGKIDRIKDAMVSTKPSLEDLRKDLSATVQNRIAQLTKTQSS